MNNDSSIKKVSPIISKSWLEVLKAEFEQEYFAQLKAFLVQEKRSQMIYPSGNKIFAAFDSTSFDEVKVVILGQDPYHGAGQANGLCFSVSPGIKPPPSLKNIFKELEDDLNIPIPNHGNLESWAKQGVLLLNATLTVRASEPGSHQKRGWETFTDAVIRKISEKREGVVFLLWGRFAQNKAELIDQTKHHVLKTTHPSPFSAQYGFLGSKHFSKANELLSEQGKTPINWAI